MNHLLRALGLNILPLGGLTFFDWSTGTALALYWIETALAIPFVIARIALHRRATGKRGHERGHFQTRPTGARGSTTLLLEFSTSATVFTLAHGLFLGLFLGALLPRQVGQPLVDLRQLGLATTAVAMILALSFARDLVGLEHRPFAWVKEEARSVLGRTVVVHLVIIAGAWLAATTNSPTSMLAVFGVLKLWVDVARAWPRKTDSPSEEVAPWFAKLMDRLPAANGHGLSFAEYYRQSRAFDLAIAEDDERRRDDPRPSPQEPASATTTPARRKKQKT